MTGRTIGEEIAGAEVYDDEVIRPLDRPVSAEGGLAILHGTLAPDGAVIKTVAASPALLRHRGPAVVFDDYPDLAARIDDPALAIDERSVLVLRGAGPVGAPGHARVGHAADPEAAARGRRARSRAHLRRAHERHELRHLRAARLAGVGRRRPARARARRRSRSCSTPRPGASTSTSSPPSSSGAARSSTPPAPQPPRSAYGELYVRHVTQAHLGCDFDFVRPGHDVPEPYID